MKKVVIYDNNSGIVKSAIPTINFTSRRDNMARYCGELNDRLILGHDLKGLEFIHPTDLRVERYVSKSGRGSLKIVNPYNGRESIIYDEKSSRRKPLIIDCDIFSGTGYGMLTREFLRRLIKTDLNFKINPLDSSMLFKSCLTAQDNVFASHCILKRDIPGPDHYTHMRIYPPRINFPRKHFNITYTMLESYSLHHFYMKMMESSYDHFICPTNFIKNMFAQYIDEKRISVVPLGIDRDIFYPGIKQTDVRFKKVNLKDNTIDYTDEKPSGFRFLSTARFSHRKGCDLTIKGFAQEFDRVKDDVSLVLFYLPENEGVPEHMTKRILQILSQFDRDHVPPVFLSDEVRPTNEQNTPYSWGDCFVLPSRGEGFGLTPLEAAGCGLPVIASNSSGLSDFINDDTSFVVPVDHIEDIGKMENGRYVGKYQEWTRDFFHPHTWNCKFSLMNTSGVINNISKHMRTVYSSPNSMEIERKKKNLSDLIDKEYNWEIATKKLYDKLKELM